MRVVSITIITVITLLIMLLTTRYWGLAQKPIPFQNEFIKNQVKTIPWIIVPGTQDELVKKYPGSTLWLDVRQVNQTLVVSPYNSNCTKEHCQDLAQWLDSRAKTPLILNITANEIDVDRHLAHLLGTQHIPYVLIHSEYANVTSAIKTLLPLFAYSSGQSERVKVATFSSLWILPAVPFRSDVYLSPLSYRGVSIVDEKIVNEMKRRNIPVIIGPLSNSSDYDLALRLKADGFFIDKNFTAK